MTNAFPPAREPLPQLVHRRLKAMLGPGDLVMDATCGNGHDTRFLAETVGPTGSVIGLDLQPSAIEATHHRLQLLGIDHVRLLVASHTDLEEVTPREWHGHVRAIVFNLGYLPGQSKSITTHIETTRDALIQSIRLLQPGGVISVLCYPGHAAGEIETRTLLQELGLESEPELKSELSDDFPAPLPLLRQDCDRHGVTIEGIASPVPGPKAPLLLWMKKTGEK